MFSRCDSIDTLSLSIISASTSGNTEYVADVVTQRIGSAAAVDSRRAELAGASDLLGNDLVILGSGTWNTGGREGQLNMHMHALLERARDIDLRGKPMTFISLGDDRYYFRTRCTEHFLRFCREHGGTLFIPPLILVNEPYGQEEKIVRWADKLVDAMRGRLEPASSFPQSHGKNTR